MPVAYPPELRSMLRASKSRSQPAPFNVSEPRRGRPYFQAIGTDRPVVWDCTFTFTTEEAQQFIRWFTYDINEGVDEFTLEIRTEFGLTEHTCHFLPDDLLTATEEGELWVYRARILARKLLLPDFELDFSWALLTSGDPGYPAPVGLHPTTHTIGPFSFDARILVGTGGTSAFDDRLLVNGVTIRPDRAITTSVPSGTVLVSYLPAGATATLNVQNRQAALCSGELFARVIRTSLINANSNPPAANVVCLLHMDGTNGGTTFVDSGPLAIAVTNNGGVQTLAAAAEYGTAGARFTGASGEGLELTNAALNLGTEYTIEWSMNTTATSGTVWRLGDESANRAELYLTTPNSGYERPRLILDVFLAGTVAQWDGVPNGMTKFRLVRTSATQIELFANGSSIGARTIISSAATSGHGNGGKLYIGANASGTSAVADMDEFRISNTAFSPGEYAIAFGAFPD